ncbi:hypothetical protein G8764_08000 [Pseudomaricurvus alcaniphilus]|uniref:hypothetical protein n=1 Tax=Pseudomaricurvus alcaniphilus TaxID=1166482 RepID=UPI00140BDDB4|nr:hypothetical protein [Pseudomaricurvus alcaniphilus]NHN37228.1 hypothetical protein [Pseudomaricurvus alcaniphilus]
MIKIVKKVLPALIVVGLTLIQGCTSLAGKQQSFDPDLRLNQLLDEYKVDLDHGVECHRHNNHLLDCRRLVRELEGLALEFPGDPTILTTTALVQFQLGRRLDSQFALDQVLAMPIIAPEAAVLRSRLALAEGNFTLARATVERQLKLAPDYPALYEVQAAIYYLEGRYDRSLLAIESADRLGAPPWRTHYHLGLIHEAKNQYAQACLHFTEVLHTEPSHRQAISRLLMLSEQEECNSRSSRSSR